jgi:hypothetical protein
MGCIDLVQHNPMRCISVGHEAEQRGTHDMRQVYMHRRIYTCG